MKYLVNILGAFFILTSLFDAWKYRWEADKIRSWGSSKGHSRKFINASIINNIARTSYGFVINDWYIVGSGFLAMYFMIDLFWTIYLDYPYKNRNLRNFKKPNLVYYIWNSFLPNKYAKKL